MKKLLKATVTYMLQDRTDPADENRVHRNPTMEFEIMDSDGFRQEFVNSEADAVLAVRESIDNALGLSSGSALGNVEIEVDDLEDED